MTIDVEFLAGTDIEQAISEAKEKALKFDVAYICFKFNGIHCSIGRNADVDDAVDRYHKANNSKTFMAVCFS